MYVCHSNSLDGDFLGGPSSEEKQIHQDTLKYCNMSLQSQSYLHLILYPHTTTRKNMIVRTLTHMQHARYTDALCTHAQCISHVYKYMHNTYSNVVGYLRMHSSFSYSSTSFFKSSLPMVERLALSNSRLSIDSLSGVGYVREA